MFGADFCDQLQGFNKLGIGDYYFHIKTILLPTIRVVEVCISKIYVVFNASFGFKKNDKLIMDCW